MLDRKQTAVQRHLRRQGSGGFEPLIQATLLAALEVAPRRVLYDVGAHIGFYAVLCSRVFPGSQVIAFEPTAQTFSLSRRVRDVNGMTFVLVNRAVSNESGATSLFISPKAETSNSLNPKFRAGSTAVKTRAVTLDEIVRDGFPPPSVLKVDAQSSEAEVLAGASTLIAKNSPAIICSFTASSNASLIREQLTDLQKKGYKFLPIKERSAKPESIKRVVELLGTGQRDWLFAKDISADFFLARERWTGALGECGPETVSLVGSGETIPDHVREALP